MASHVQLLPPIFPILKKLSTPMPDLLPIILLQCLALCSTVLQSTKLVPCMVLLPGRFNTNTTSNNITSGSPRKDVLLLPYSFLILPINIKHNIRVKTVYSKHYPHPPFTVTININPLLHQLLNRPVLPPPILVQEAPYSYANLSDALNPIATRAINKRMDSNII